PHVAFNILLFYGAVGGVAALLLLWRPTILETLFHDPTLAALSGPIAILVFLMVAFSFLELIALADADVRAASLLIVVMNLTKMVLLVGAAFVFASFEALVYAAIVQGLLQAAVLLWYLTTRFPGFRRGPDWPLMRAQLVYAIPLGTAAILSVVQADLPEQPRASAAQQPHERGRTRSPRLSCIHARAAAAPGDHSRRPRDRGVARGLASAARLGRRRRGCGQCPRPGRPGRRPGTRAERLVAPFPAAR